MYACFCARFWLRQFAYGSDLWTSRLCRFSCIAVFLALLSAHAFFEILLRNIQNCFISKMSVLDCQISQGQRSLHGFKKEFERKAISARRTASVDVLLNNLSALSKDAKVFAWLLFVFCLFRSVFFLMICSKITLYPKSELWICMGWLIKIYASSGQQFCFFPYNFI